MSVKTYTGQYHLHECTRRNKANIMNHDDRRRGQWGCGNISVMECISVYELAKHRESQQTYCNNAIDDTKRKHPQLLGNMPICTRTHTGSLGVKYPFSQMDKVEGELLRCFRAESIHSHAAK